MVPPEFSSFFVTCATAAAALIGLLFVAVSIAPEATVAEKAPVERQAVAASAFTALVVAFFISVAAQIPHTNIGVAVVIAGLVGVLNTFTWLRIMARAKLRRTTLLRGLAMVAISAGVYIDVAWQGAQLAAHPSGVGSLYVLDWLLIAIFGIGLVRAWELLGVRRYGILGGWLNPLQDVDTEWPEKRRPPMG